MKLPRVGLDIETDLKHKTIWCVGLKRQDCGKEQLYVADHDLGVMDGLRPFSDLPAPDSALWSAHNGAHFDFPLLKDVLGWDAPFECWEDTLLMSKMHDPNQQGGHSLDNLGKVARRYAIKKQWGVEPALKMQFDVEDFDWGFTEKMGKYCLGDLRVQLNVSRWLWDRYEKMRFTNMEDVLNMEQRIRVITDWQQANGITLDQEHAHEIYSGISSREREIEEEMQLIWPPIITERYSDKQVDKETGEPKRLKDDVQVFNPGSRPQIAKRLEMAGHKWTKFTEKTEKGGGENVIIDPSTLEPIADKYEGAAQCLEYLTIGKRRGMVEGWLKRVEPDGRVYGKVDTLGAVTGRMTHSSPNLAQVEKGQLMRSSWIAAPGKVMVGCDASGLELRMLAHYMKDEEYIAAVAHGDVHWKNVIAMGLAEPGSTYDEDDPEQTRLREMLKTWVYAFLYGSGTANLGKILGGSQKLGAAKQQQFLDATPALKDLRDKLERMAAQGHIPGLDGRRIRIRKKHAVLNSLLQSAGAIIMKRGLLIAADDLAAQGIAWKLLLQVHDEIQCECAPEVQQQVGLALEHGIRDAGKYYDMRIPLAGQAKFGVSWADTH